MNINKKIEELREELKKLDNIVEKRFKTSKELQSHISRYKNEYQKAHDLGEQIQELELELMTPEERKVEEELVAKMKIKREGKL